PIAEYVITMMRVRVSLPLLALLPVAAFSQTAETAPRFEVADVHNSPRVAQPLQQGPFYGDGRYEIRYATMLDLVRLAYNVDPEKVSGGPSWLEMDRFDVFAKTSAGSPEVRRRMLQSLLADRFKLTTHNDSRPMDAIALTAGKHKLKEAENPDKTG